MFKECLNDLPYVSDIADECYFNIKLFYDNRDKQIFDDSFLTTMRIALSKRTENRVDLVYFYKDASNYINFSGNDFISKLTDDLSSTTNRYTQLFIFNLDNYREQIVDDCFERLNSFATYFDGFEEINDLKAFFEQKKIAKCRFFTNYERKTTVIFVKKLTPRVNHMLQSLLPRYLKWEFEDAPITDDEKKLFRSLTQKTAGEYVEIINNYAKSQNFEEIKIKRLLGDFDKRIFDMQLEEVSNTILSYESQLKRLYSQVEEYISKINQLTTDKFGLTVRRDSADSNELMDYFLCNNNVDLVSVDDNEIKFIVTTYINSFDFDNYEVMFQNENSILYRNGCEYFIENNYENRKLLLSALFDEQLLKLKICAAFRIKSGRGASDVDGLQHYAFPNKYINYLPNQHIQQYECLGDNRREIIVALNRGDYICAIEQCISSAGNINMADTAVLPHFIEEIFDEDADKIIELPDGESVTPMEAVEWLKKVEN